MKLKDYTIYIVTLLIVACSPSYNLQSIDDEVIAIEAPIDSTILNIILPYQNSIEAQMNEVLCISKMEMKKGKPESLLGNFVTDLCLEQFSESADVCIMNTGGLRSTLPKGKITRGEIYKLMPFENELVVLELNKSDFEGMLEYIASRGGEPFSGMKFNSSKESRELQVFSLGENFNFNKEDKVRVLTSDYLANGGDKMWFFKNKEQLKLGTKLRDAIINYCSNSDTISSKLDNRLTITEDE
jgi:2',3'-cyclic-nucleotide 2'-phosphodiesterase (5'-nucleotidase family)